MTRAALFLLLLGCACGARTTDPHGRSPAGPPLRILLREASQRPRIHITASGTYRVLDEETGRTLAEGRGLDRMEPLVASGSSALRVRPEADTLAVDGVRYPGDLLLVPDGDRVLPIVEADVESYLPGVLAGELSPAFPPACLRAQAVASRTYALQRRSATPPLRPWHVADDTSSQVFRGLVEDSRLLAAVEDTRGMLLTWRGSPLPAYFHSTCGGHTVSAHEVFGGEPLPPLTGVPCEWCGSSRYHRWSAEVPFPDLLASLGLAGPLRGAEVSRRGEGGRALEFSFLAPTPVHRSASDVRMRLGTSRLRSTLVFEIERRGNLLVFRGGGWGHGVGMCQIGARGLAGGGASAGDILTHYYPGALLSRWY